MFNSYVTLPEGNAIVNQPCFDGLHDSCKVKLELLSYYGLFTIALLTLHTILHVYHLYHSIHVYHPIICRGSCEISHHQKNARHIHIAGHLS